MGRGQARDGARRGETAFRFGFLQCCVVSRTQRAVRTLLDDITVAFANSVCLLSRRRALIATSDTYARALPLCVGLIVHCCGCGACLTTCRGGYSGGRGRSNEDGKVERLQRVSGVTSQSSAVRGRAFSLRRGSRGLSVHAYNLFALSCIWTCEP